MLRNRIHSYSTEFFFPQYWRDLHFDNICCIRISVCLSVCLPVCSKSTYDSLVWLGFFDLSKLLKNIGLSAFGVLKVLTGYRTYSRSLYYFPSRFPSVLRGNHTSSIRATSPKFMCHIYQKLNITTLQNCSNWCLIRDMVGQVNFVLHCRFSNLSCSADHSRTNFLKLGRWNKQSQTQEF